MSQLGIQNGEVLHPSEISINWLDRQHLAYIPDIFNQKCVLE